MSGELEAAGAMATAGLVAGAIEGQEPGAAGEGLCLNCGAPVQGRFCSNCGQAARPHRTLSGLVGEFVANLWHLDTKAWRTLPMVVFRPGTLTRDFVYGKRARYFSPLATFLLSIFLMFFAFSFVEAPVEMGGAPQEQRAAAVERLAEAREALAEAEAELAQARTAPDPDSPAGLEERLALQAVSLARAEVSRREAAIARIDAVIAEQAQRDAERATPVEEGAPTPEANSGAAPAQGAPAEEAAPAEAVEGAPETEGAAFNDGETWQDGVRRMAESDEFVVAEGMPELNERVRRKLANPDLALYQIQEAASKFSFLLAPLSLPFIALLFLWKRGLTFYDHVVYALYALSFAALLFVAVIITAQHEWTRWLPGWLILVGLPVHMYFHLKGAYALGWWSALWRTFFMLNFALIAAIIFLIIVIVLGLAG
jgi:hypothetical protein